MPRHMIFAGVSTAQSSMMRIFPAWRDRLDLGPDIQLVGCDLPIHAPAERYRDVVAKIKDDETCMGALVTTHKIDLYWAAADLFDEVDEYVRLCGEVNCIVRRDGNLAGFATDPVASGRALEHALEPRHFAESGGAVLCFGGGGAAAAISTYLLQRRDTPGRLTFTDLEQGRLDNLRRIHKHLNPAADVRYVLNGEPTVNDQLLESLPAGSLVINATGMGKDRPGSPISPAATFPLEAHVWEINYRGDLPFLYQAWGQRERRSLRVEDGWIYFLHGWTSVISHIFDRPISGQEMQDLARLARFARPSLPTSAAGEVESDGDIPV